MHQLLECLCLHSFGLCLVRLSRQLSRRRCLLYFEDQDCSLLLPEYSSGNEWPSGVIAAGKGNIMIQR